MNIPLLFDMDGVIAHTNPYHKVAIRKFCAHHQIAIDEEALAKNVYGRANQQWIPDLFGALDDETLLKLSIEKEAIFRELYAPYLAAVFGLYEFLESTKDLGWPMIVATSAPMVNADFVLDGLNIRQYFDAIVCGDDVKIGKPDPEIYLLAASKAGVEPSQCAVIEDSFAGVKAGKSAGCKVVGIGTTHSSDELEGCDLFSDDFLDLTVGMIENLF